MEKQAEGRGAQILRSTACMLITVIDYALCCQERLLLLK
jgi:hypothetical protein